MPLFNKFNIFNKFLKKTKTNINFDKDLNENEKYIINYLKKVLKYHNREDIELRVAGGWVRDKLLNYKNEKLDLDFAINNSSGVEFVDLIQKYRIENENQDKFNEYTIKMNPEKSKHLETVSIKIEDFTIEFNALRSDQYDENSRIPIIKEGTLQSDSLRRDLTINSLFYNINTNKVEDHSGLGLFDLENGIIRTPLEPFNTLTEDPLRAFRILRFSTKFNFQIEPTLYKYIKTINDNIIKKVSKERVYNEFYLMMSIRKYSEKYFEYLIDTGIINTIFILNGFIKEFNKTTKEIWSDSMKFIKISNQLFPTSDEIESLDFYCTLIFYPFFKTNKILNQTQISSILKEFRAPSKLINQLEKNLETSEKFLKLIENFINYQKKENKNIQLKEFLILKENKDDVNELIYSLKKNNSWILSLYLSFVDIKFNDSIKNHLNLNLNSNVGNNKILFKLLEESIELGDKEINDLLIDSINNKSLNESFQEFRELIETIYYPLSQISLLVDGKELIDSNPKIKDNHNKDPMYLRNLMKSIYFYQINNSITKKQDILNYLNKI